MLDVLSLRKKGHYADECKIRKRKVKENDGASETNLFVGHVSNEISIWSESKGKADRNTDKKVTFNDSVEKWVEKEIPDYSRKQWNYFMKAESVVPSILDRYISMMKAKDVTINKIRWCDNV